ncbi:TM2 domain-containing protein [Desulfolutivibrio sp.]|uniref:TM2 domain-containing protein n=1 Tax=Desulfolutivibrio sp. TaxID=2773296 RepID=UPI002F962E03
MKGRVLSWDGSTKSGVISGEDGQRYGFSLADWKSGESPVAGVEADFVPREGAASEIFLLASASTAGPNKVIAALLAFFLGGFGIHKFYLGYKKQGLIMLLVFLFGFILAGIPSMIIGLVSLVECFMYISKSDAEFRRVYVEGSKPWF